MGSFLFLYPCSTVCLMGGKVHEECGPAGRRHTTIMELSIPSVLVAGCVHADAQWLFEKLLPSAAEHEAGAVLVAGDFGYWRHSDGLIKAASTSKKRFGVETWFIDGNH